MKFFVNNNPILKKIIKHNEEVLFYFLNIIEYDYKKYFINSNDSTEEKKTNFLNSLNNVNSNIKVDIDSFESFQNNGFIEVKFINTTESNMYTMLVGLVLLENGSLNVTNITLMNENSAKEAGFTISNELAEIITDTSHFVSLFTRNKTINIGVSVLDYSDKLENVNFPLDLIFNNLKEKFLFYVFFNENLFNEEEHNLLLLEHDFSIDNEIIKDIKINNLYNNLSFNHLANIYNL